VQIHKTRRNPKGNVEKCEYMRNGVKGMQEFLQLLFGNEIISNIK
jgi:hypothetical protein